ncbi:GNAT family N-acetyltransferase [Rhodococcus rhodnii]|uniref:Acetyltransferase n=2 Tax=Rhodococcus rhodnii TaxID=38312 RepID=R7WPY5_9NOCA|nr:GNAT family N-acetyltransferase [Rhodococcus rhodnii]EOM77363.1 acetyltransferase [Rhodococcus rhodnii LMG 5362]TXG91732.1 GNAT family N-acetyltransferase [Rhodococcus rhodnii]
MDDHPLDIVRLAWARELGLDDDALAVGGHVDCADEHTSTVRFVWIADASALVGPQWLLDRAQDHTRRELTEAGTLLGLTLDHSGRCPGPRTLAYSTEYSASPPEPPPLVSHDRADARALEAACPPDDVENARLTQRSHWFTIVEDEHSGDDAHRPVAGAAYDEMQGLIGELGVLTDPVARRRGLGATALSIATDELLDDGLVAGLRWHRENTAAEALARARGYDPVGTYIEVSIGPARSPSGHEAEEERSE